ncbi:MULTISPECIES: 50S ribosomal protein L29 [Rickettsieae]|jgi:large subunit ribosomal protein L29|uniref:50S ribosomal protein L29 n=1 Tax=Rickettsieae TaxID=33988 RepID=UPI000B9C4387|nr:50S ribosomal protein L29 [Rickettsia endosymbiont of Culicoides newsteadi]MDN3030678.1 50S ribosomal protein L29 [Candidatus Tisiphia sp.]OZG32244.1 50S ribosomal protein L29 [Rickettsia endosymbiont of Culicoides newsteadi]HJD57166.1 50S ribosomal protein L29 [Rickettsia endosymbiont of Sericostoma sp. HW-2014]HJD63664.1 50S ribosomal protein L29 [Rickettsia endosymbiont of Sericostoma sp.]
MSKLGLSPKELVGQTMEELHEKRILFKKELFNLRFQKTLGELENTSRFSFVKKTIARINTELTTRSKTGE